MKLELKKTTLTTLCCVALKWWLMTTLINKHTPSTKPTRRIQRDHPNSKTSGKARPSDILHVLYVAAISQVADAPPAIRRVEAGEARAYT